jgi:hypothetical protein
MFRSKGVGEVAPFITETQPKGRCRFYGMCMAYASNNPHAPQPGCSDGGRGKTDYCGLAAPSRVFDPGNYD